MDSSASIPRDSISVRDNSSFFIYSAIANSSSRANSGKLNGAGKVQAAQNHRSLRAHEDLKNRRNSSDMASRLDSAVPTVIRSPIGGLLELALISVANLHARGIFGASRVE